jgi:hypothetical protein
MSVMSDCGMASKYMHSIMQNKFINKDIHLSDQYMFSFRVNWNGSNIGLSLSVPVDANMHHDKRGFMFETALWNHEKSTIAYYESWDYDDVNRFTTYEELFEEVLRVREISFRIPYEEPNDSEEEPNDSEEEPNDSEEEPNDPDDAAAARNAAEDDSDAAAARNAAEDDSDAAAARNAAEDEDDDMFSINMAALDF